LKTAQNKCNLLEELVARIFFLNVFIISWRWQVSSRPS